MIKFGIGIVLLVIVIIGAITTLVSLISNIDLKGDDDDDIFKP